MTDDALVAQLRAYAQQLDELPVAPRLERARHTRWRPPRWSRREWIALAAAVAVLVAVAVGRIVEQSSGGGTTPSVSTGGTLTVTRAWTRDLGAQVDRTIDVPGGRTLVDVAPENTGDSTLVAFDRRSGKVLWRHRFPYRNGPWGLDGDVLVTGIDGRTAGIDLRTGRQLWIVDVNAVPGEQAPPILVRDHVAYLVGGDQGVMTALEVRTHHVLWRHTLGGTVLVSPIATSDSIIAAVSPLPLDGEPGAMVSLNPETGSVYDVVRPVAGKDVRGLVATPDGGVAVTSRRFSTGGPLLVSSAALTISTPSTSCSVPIDGEPSNPIVSDAGEVIVAANDGSLGAYTCGTDGIGRTVWQRREAGVSEQPAMERAASVLVVAGNDLSGVAGSPASFRWTAAVRDAYFPAPAAGDVVVATSRTDGRLAVVDARDGSIVKTVRNGTSLNAVTLRAGSLVTASDQGTVTGYRITRR